MILFLCFAFCCSEFLFSLYNTITSSETKYIISLVCCYCLHETPCQIVILSVKILFFMYCFTHKSSLAYIYAQFFSSSSPNDTYTYTHIVDESNMPKGTKFCILFSFYYNARIVIAK